MSLYIFVSSDQCIEYCSYKWSVWAKLGRSNKGRVCLGISISDNKGKPYFIFKKIVIKGTWNFAFWKIKKMDHTQYFTIKDFYRKVIILIKCHYFSMQFLYFVFFVFLAQKIIYLNPLKTKLMISLLSPNDVSHEDLPRICIMHEKHSPQPKIRPVGKP